MRSAVKSCRTVNRSPSVVPTVLTCVSPRGRGLQVRFKFVRCSAREAGWYWREGEEQDEGPCWTALREAREANRYQMILGHGAGVRGYSGQQRVRKSQLWLGWLACCGAWMMGGWAATGSVYKRGQWCLRRDWDEGGRVQSWGSWRKRIMRSRGLCAKWANASACFGRGGRW